MVIQFHSSTSSKKHQNHLYISKTQKPRFDRNQPCIVAHSPPTEVVLNHVWGNVHSVLIVYITCYILQLKMQKTA